MGQRLGVRSLVWLAFAPGRAHQEVIVVKDTKIAALFLGVLGVLVGAALVAGSISLLVADRDDDGFFTSEDYPFEQESFAIVSEDIDLLADAPAWLIDWITDPVDLRIQGTNDGTGGLFLGIANTPDVESYLAGVAHHQVTNLDFDGSSIVDIEYESRVGTVAPNPPGSEGFWEISTDGAGTQTLDWSLESGNWTVAVMNADGSAGVDVDLMLGAKISNIIAVAWVALGFGVVSVLGGGYLTYRGIRPSREDEPAPRMVHVDEGIPPVESAGIEEEPALK